MIFSNLKKLMKEKKITMKQLEDMTGMSPSTINKARQDDGIAECRLSTLGRIATALGVPVKTLFDGEWEPQEAEDTDKA
jgi:transcriptional regulator with XRE-family HTH domain